MSWWQKGINSHDIDQVLSENSIAFLSSGYFWANCSYM